MSRKGKKSTKDEIDEMPDWYRVKLWFKSNPKMVRFAKFERYGEDSEKHWREGNALFADAITGHLFLVPHQHPELVVEKQPFDWGERDPETDMEISTEYDRHINEAYKEAVKLHKKAGKGVKKNKLCSIGVADGMAVYVITKVNKKTCKIEWRAFGGGDDYVDRRWGYQSTIPIREAGMYLNEFLLTQ